jgi:cation:H+ antiporter
VTDILLILLGFIGLLFGGNYLVQGAVEIARRFGISPLVIGLTLVGFGTSMPELVTSVQAAFADSPGIALGNVIGSNIANILLILGLAALIRPIATDRAALRRDGGTLALATLCGLAVVLTGSLSRPVGGLLVLALLVYVLVTLAMERRRATPPMELPGGSTERPLWLSLLALLGGLVLTIVAARFLILGAVSLARTFEISEAVIGLTVVAVGTSLPELVTSAIAARKGESDVALGNIIGSNVFNILGILGVTALLSPLTVPAQFSGFDVWVMVGATAALLVFAHSASRISRTEGGLLLAAYVAYTGALVAMA